MVRATGSRLRQGFVGQTAAVDLAGLRFRAVYIRLRCLYDVHGGCIRWGHILRTTVVIDDELMARLLAVGGFRTKREAIVTAMEDFVRRRERESFVELRGAIAFEDDHLGRLDSLEGSEDGEPS